MSGRAPLEQQEILKWRGVARSLINKATASGSKYATLAIVAITYAYMFGVLGSASVSTPVWVSFLSTTAGIGTSVIATVLLDFMRGQRTNEDLENALREQGDKIDESFLSINIELQENVTHVLLELILSREAASQEHQALSDQLSNLRAMVSSLIEMQSVERQPSLASDLFFVPLRKNKHFIGRERLLIELHNKLQPDPIGSTTPVMVWACGGMGKTQLAVEYAYLHREDYPSGIFWINASRNWRQEAVDLGSALGVGSGAGTEAERLMRVPHNFGEYLNQHTNALLIIDNVDDPRRICESEAGFIPSSLKCHVLFTTIRSWKHEYPFQSLEVKTLDETEALDLLLFSDPWRPVLEKCRSNLQDPETHAVRKICRTLGYLPLALTMASVFLARNYQEVTLEAYLRRILGEGGLKTVDTAGLDERDLATLHRAAVSATLKIQWDSIKSSDSRLVLQICSLLEESLPVPFARLSLLSSLSSQNAPGYPSPLRGTISELEDWTLIDILDDNKSLRVHPMVREFTRTTIPDVDKLATQCADRLANFLTDMGKLNQEVSSRGIDAVMDDMRVGLTINAFTKVWGPL